jgi:hypothetical protein
LHFALDPALPGGPTNQTDVEQLNDPHPILFILSSVFGCAWIQFKSQKAMSCSRFPGF